MGLGQRGGDNRSRSKVHGEDGGLVHAARPAAAGAAVLVVLADGPPAPAWEEGDTRLCICVKYNLKFTTLGARWPLLPHRS